MTTVPQCSELECRRDNGRFERGRAAADGKRAGNVGQTEAVVACVRLSSSTREHSEV
jgi:hypothetical protein